MVRGLICGWGCLALSIAAGCAGGQNVYVASDGNDAWSGRLAEPDQAKGDGPLASLEAARDAIRKFKQSSASPRRPITVWIRGGKYERERAFELTAEDSGTEKAPIVYRNYPGETVRLIGGRRIDFYPAEDPSIGDWLAPEAEGRIYEADLQTAGLMDYGRMSRRGFGIPIAPAGLELFFHDRPMQLARWPNRGWLRIADVPDGPHAGRFAYSGDRPERWVHSADIWVHGFCGGCLLELKIICYEQRILYIAIFGNGVFLKRRYENY